MEPIRWLDLSIQVITLALIIYAYWVFKWGKKLRRHAYAFTVATLLNSAGVVIIMVPLFLNDWAEVTLWPLDAHAAFLWVHHILGLVATVMSLFIVIRWTIHHRNPKKCRGKLFMNSTLVVWLATLLMGFWLFASDLLA